MARRKGASRRRSGGMDRFGQAFMTLGLSAVGARLLANLFNKEEKPSEEEIEEAVSTIENEANTTAGGGRFGGANVPARKQKSTFKMDPRLKEGLRTPSRPTPSPGDMDRSEALGSAGYIPQGKEFTFAPSKNGNGGGNGDREPRSIFDRVSIRNTTDAPPGTLGGKIPEGRTETPSGIQFGGDRGQNVPRDHAWPTVPTDRGSAGAKGNGTSLPSPPNAGKRPAGAFPSPGSLNPQQLEALGWGGRQNGQAQASAARNGMAAQPRQPKRPLPPGGEQLGWDGQNYRTRADQMQRQQQGVTPRPQNGQSAGGGGGRFGGANVRRSEQPNMSSLTDQQLEAELQRRMMAGTKKTLQGDQTNVGPAIR